MVHIQEAGGRAAAGRQGGKKQEGKYRYKVCAMSRTSV